MKKISVFASGGGSNLESIINNIEQGRLSAEIAFVLSNNSASMALERARNHNIKAIHFSSMQYLAPQLYADELLNLHKEHDIDFVVLAGYMKLLPLSFVRAYKGRILNIHPALLPKHGGKGMYGIHVHEAVIKAGDTESGATVHFVTEVYDEGPIILQEKVPVYPQDTPEVLAKRVLTVEHMIYPKAIGMVLDGEIKIP